MSSWTAPPTAETLRLLSIPDVGRWWFDRLFPIGRRATLAQAPLARPLLNSMPLPDRETFDATEGLFDQLGDMHRVLSNPETSSMRLVLNPEKMVIKEAQRTYTYLNLYGYVTDAIVCNRVMPQQAAGSYLGAWLETQAKYLQLVEEAFAPLPILTVPYFEQEVVGFAMLRRLAMALFGEGDPSRIFFQGQTHHIKEQNGEYVLAVPLPFVEKRDISLLSKGDELTVQVRGYRRSFILPWALMGLQTQGAKFEGDVLRIRFRWEERELRQ